MAMSCFGRLTVVFLLLCFIDNPCELEAPEVMSRLSNALRRNRLASSGSYRTPEQIHTSKSSYGTPSWAQSSKQFYTPASTLPCQTAQGLLRKSVCIQVPHCPVVATPLPSQLVIKFSSRSLHCPGNIKPVSRSGNQQLGVTVHTADRNYIGGCNISI